MVYTIRVYLYANRTKMEAGDCPTLNMNAMENYLLSQSLKQSHNFWTRWHPLLSQHMIYALP